MHTVLLQKFGNGDASFTGMLQCHLSTVVIEVDELTHEGALFHIAEVRGFFEPDVVLVDIGSLGSIDKIFVETIKRHTGQCAVIAVLDSGEITKYRTDLLNARYDDYLHYASSLRECLAVMHARLPSPEQFKSIVVQNVLLDLNSYRVFVDDTIVHLTPTEMCVFVHLFKNSNTVVSRKDLQNVLSDSGVRSRNYYQYINQMVTRIRSKIRWVDTRAGNIIQSVRRDGYRVTDAIKR